MNLRLLTFGRSWTAKKLTTQSPYRASYGLPKFNTDRSPRIEGKPAEQLEVKIEAKLAERSGERKSEPTTGEGKRNFGFENFEKAIGSFVGGIYARLFSKSASNVFAAKRTRQPVVQSELSLERVTVLRNDLSNADLEVVPMNTVINPARGKTTKPIEPMSVSMGEPVNRVMEMFETETQTH